MNVLYLQSQFVIEYVIAIIGIIILLGIPRYARLFWNIDNHIITIPTDRSSIIDTLKGIAIIGVIIIHSCYFLLSLDTSSNDIIILSLINNLFRFAIPIFFFTSGLLLKPFIWDQKSIIHFYLSKFVRIGIPYIIITTALWQSGYGNANSLITSIITGTIAIPFYFVPVLFQLYVLYPLLDYIRKMNPYYLIGGSLVISIVSFLNPSSWELWGIPLCGQYLIFFTYGMVRKNIFTDPPTTIWRELIAVYIILQLIGVTILTYLDVNKDILKSLFFYNFQLLFGLAVIFTLIRYFQNQNTISITIQKLLSPIGKISLWIFLLHFPIQILFTPLFTISARPIIIDLIIHSMVTLIITVPLAYFLNFIYTYTQLSETLVKK